MANAPALYAPVMSSWKEIRADGNITLPEWWKFSTVVFGVAVNAATGLIGKTGPEKLEWATSAAAEVLLYVAPTLAGKAVGAVLYVVSWVGWSWPVVRTFFRTLYAGTVKAGVQVEYEKKLAEMDAIQKAAQVAILERQLSILRSAIGEATGGPNV